MRRLLPALVLILALGVPASAMARGMEIGMQDDQTILYGYHDRVLALKQFKAMGGTTVRINFEHRRNSNYDDDVSARASRGSLKLYDAAVNAVVAARLKPQLTLVWHDRTDPVYIAAWMRNVALHFGPRVNRYSILNEPDLLLPVHGACRAAGERRMVRRFPGRMIYVRGEYRAKVETYQRAMNLHTACLRYRRGLEYAEIAKAAYAAIVRGNPEADVLAGETSAQVGLEWFVRAVRPWRLDVDGWAHHPFQLHDLNPHKPANGWGIGNLRMLKRLIELPIYLTEFGYPHPNSSMDLRVMGRKLKPREIAATLPKAWRIARRAGARQMLQYQWYVKPKWRKEYWETALLNADNGRTTPAYRALRRLVLSWK